MSKLITLPWVSTSSNLPTLVSSNTELTAFQSQILTNSGESILANAISTANISAISDFIISMKYAIVETTVRNLYSKIAYCLPLAGLTLAAAKTPLIGASAATITGYVSGDYTQAGGLVGNGSKSLNTGLSVSSLSSDDLGILVLTKGSNASGVTHDVFVGSGTSTFGMLIQAARVTSFAFTVSGNGVVDTSAANIGSPAMHGWNRASAVITQFKNAATVATGVAAGTRPSATVPIFRNNNTYGGCLITNGATNAEFAYISSRFQTLMTAFGR